MIDLVIEAVGLGLLTELEGSDPGPLGYVNRCIREVEHCDHGSSVSHRDYSRQRIGSRRLVRAIVRNHSAVG